MSVPALLAFFVLHLVIGAAMPLPRNAAPPFLRLMDGAGRELARRLNRPERGGGELLARGMAVLVVMTLVALVIGGAALRLSGFPHGWLVLVVFLFGLVSAMGPVRVLLGVAKSLGAGQNEKAAALLQPHAPDDLARADTHTLARRALEWSALALNRYLAGPVFWFLAGGIVWAVLYMTWTGLYLAFRAQGRGRFSLPVHIADEILNIAPAMLSVLLLSLSALFVSRARGGAGLGLALKNAGGGTPCWVLSAMAGALGVTLGGPPDRGWTGPEGSSAKVSIEDIKRGAMIHFVFFLCLMALVSAGVII